MDRENFLQRYADGQRDFTGNDLRGINLSRVDLRMGGNNFSNGILFYQTDLTHANFRHADLSRGCFELANLVGADFTGANLGSTDFDGADLTDACLTGADVTGANFGSANMTRIDLTDAVGGWSCEEPCLEGAIFPDGTVEGVDDTSHWCAD